MEGNINGLPEKSVVYILLFAAVLTPKYVPTYASLYSIEAI